ncbi:MAG: TolC family protein [Akkermansiaceae bacterium]|nr:TolC family protein [Akkermansiaceae bacterium]MDP4847951.1 TolC family protein [Akkermansiaceae bacterium]MDP4896590.1 TolC family protein [Akkermansiaceae bacterium]
MSFFKTILIGTLLPGALLHAQQTKLLDNTFLHSIRSETAHAHPAVTSAENLAEAAIQDTRALRLWDDPTVGIGFMAARRPQMRREEGDVMASLSIPLPKPGLYQAQREKSEAMERMEQEKIRAASIGSGTEAAMLAIELALSDEVIKLLQGELAWLREMEINASQMALAPSSTGIDSIRISTELVKSEETLAAAISNREGLSQRLNLVMGRTLDREWQTLRLPKSAPAVPIAASEVARIPFTNPRMLAMKEIANATHADIRIADRERLPSFGVGVETRAYSGSSDGYRGTTLGLSMSIPWFNKDSYDAKIDAAKSRTEAAIGDVETTRREIADQVIQAATEAANAASQSRAYAGEIRTKAIEANDSIQASWINSKAPLTDLLESRRLLFSVDLEQRRFIAMQLAAIEKLNLLVPSK